MRAWFRIRLHDSLGEAHPTAIVLKVRLDRDTPFRSVAAPNGLHEWRFEPDAVQIPFLPAEATLLDPIRFASFVEAGSLLVCREVAPGAVEVAWVDHLITIRARSPRERPSLEFTLELQTPLHPRAVTERAPRATVLRGTLTADQWLEDSRYLTFDDFRMLEDAPLDPDVPRVGEHHALQQPARRRAADVFTTRLQGAPWPVLTSQDEPSQQHTPRLPALLDPSLVVGDCFVTDGADALPLLTPVVRLSTDYARENGRCLVPHAWLRVAEWSDAPAPAPARRQRALRVLRVAPFNLQPAWSARCPAETSDTGERGMPRHLEAIGPHFDWVSSEPEDETWRVRVWFGGAPRPPAVASLYEGWWSEQVARPLHRALRDVRPELGVSLIPELAEVDGAQGRHHGFGVSLSFKRERDAGAPYRLRLLPGVELLPRQENGLSLARVVDVSFPMFRDERGDAVASRLLLTSKVEGDGRDHRVTLTLSGHRQQASRTVRVGAVRLGVPQFAPSPQQVDATDRLSMNLCVRVAPTERGWWRAELAASPADKPTLDLPLGPVELVGVDPLPAELTATGLADIETLVVPLESYAVRGARMEATETPARDASAVEAQVSDHDLALEVYMPQRREGGGDGEVRFALALVQLGPLALLRVDGAFLADAKTILRWSDDGGRVMRWFARGTGKVTLTLPPQAVGEDMLLDLASDYNKGLPFRYRFSPPTRVELEPPLRARAETIVPSNLGQLLGDTAGGAVGLPVESVSTELLYGLTLGVQGGRLSLAELDARLGRTPPPLSKDLLLATVQGSHGEALAAGLGDALESRATALAALQRALASRLAWLEALDRGRPEREIALEKGATSRLRPSRRIAYDVTEPGVRGGADWPIRSKNVRDQLADAEATRTRVEGLALTMLGGFGRQRSEFHDGVSVIEADVRLGRVHRYTFQRLGRVGCLYHRARYVVVYERVVAEEGPFAGRSVLVVTDEYVEILQKVRRYPDDGSPAWTNGLCVGATFGCERIPVKAAWGWDTHDGWVLPLLDPKSRDKPEHDPMLGFLCATPPSQSSGEHGTPVTDPESLANLVFYTRTAPGQSPDSDRWPASLGVDFEAGAPPDAATCPSPVLSGFERFTFRVDSGSTPTNLTAARGVDPVAAVLRTVTVARRGAVPTAPAVARIFGAAAAARQLVGQGGGSPGAALGDLAAILGDLGAPGTVRARLRNAQSQMNAQGIAHVNLLKQELRHVFDLPRADWSAIARPLIEMALRKGSVLDELARGVAAVQRAVARANTELPGLFAAAGVRLRALTEVDAARLEVARVTRDIVDAALAALAPAEAFCEGAMTALRDGLGAWLAAAKGACDAGGAVGEALKAAWEAFGRAMATEGARVAALVDDVAKELERRSADVRKKIDEEVTRVVASVANADDLVEALTASVKAIGAAALAKIDDAVASLAGDLARLVRSVGSFDPSGLARRIMDVLPTPGSAAVEDERRALDAAARAWWSGALGGVIGPLATQARQAIDTVEQGAGAAGLALLRAWGAAPVAASLDFDREAVEYVFREGDIALTRARALVRGASAIARGELPSFGLSVPIGSITDRFVPDLTPDLSKLGELLPRLAGLDLTRLLAGLGSEDVHAIGRSIVIQHGVDKRTLQAWAEASLDRRVSGPQTLIEFGGAKASIVDPRVFVRMRAVASAAGLRHECVARIEAAWALTMGGDEVLRLDDVVLEASPERGLRFEVSPTKVRLRGILLYLQNLLERVPVGGGSGFSLEVTGAAATARLTLALPALQFGAFSVSGLAFSTAFGIGYAGAFSLSVGASLATRERPFNLSVLCLGGGGWFGTSLRWVADANQKPEASLSFGVSVGASLPFDIGVASGCVQILVDGALEWRNGDKGAVSFSVGATLRGELDILGVISVSITIALSVTYEPGGSLILRGRLEVKIKIFFFSISVSTGFEKRLAGERASRMLVVDDTLHDSVARYLRAFSI